MSSSISTDELYGIHVFSSAWGEHSRVLKHQDTFAVFSRSGDILPIGPGQQGVFHRGTRHLSCLEITVQGILPLVLSSGVRADNVLLTVDATTPDLPGADLAMIEQDTLHFSRTQLIWDQTCYIRCTFTNYGIVPVVFQVDARFEADFADIFEVRGMSRDQRGVPLAPETVDSWIRLRYLGRDDVERLTTISITPSPDTTTADSFSSRLSLASGESCHCDIMISCDLDSNTYRLGFDAALGAAEQSLRTTEDRWTAVSTSNDQFDEWLLRSAADVRVLVTETDRGPYPYAGIPWFSTAFGRDGIITGLETLWLNPDLAGGVLRYLAALQADTDDVASDAQPGKILHETREGEMAALGEHPFRAYYGTVDATPLFVALAGSYYRSTGDDRLIREIWPNIVAAIEWIDNYGDADGDGFVEYARRTPAGLENQGWKDSGDSIFHADGRLATGPIALCEVQGYVYAARMAAAELAELFDHGDFAGAQRAAASRLQERFDDAFWDDELGAYVIALDGEKRPCRVVTSNPGHCLLTGIVPAERAGRLARRLLAGDLFSGWGIRTLAVDQARYNPMSYHNGSVWPHDNAMIAAGLARYGFKQATIQLLTATFEAAMHMDMQRMPELFCGFERMPHQGPTLYPVACLPQAWSAASVFMLLGACLGLEVVAPDNEVRITRPALPDYLQRVRIERLRVGDGSIDLEFHRYPSDIGVSVLRREGAVRVVTEK